MESSPTTPPLVAVVGETASGKSALAFEIARRFRGELICADSRTVYKGMDIGTAKPSAEERVEIAHHMLDVADPGTRFTAADFKQGAVAAIADCHERGMLPIIVGGTGLYIDAVLFDYQFGGKADEGEREALSQQPVEVLNEMLKQQHISLPENDKNKRHLVRLLERGNASERHTQLRSNTLVVGLQLSRSALRTRIEKRIELMFRQGLRREVQKLQATYGWQSEALTGIGYREFKPFYEDRATMGDVKRQIVQDTLQLAKRQRTWFKRNPAIVWRSSADEALAEVEQFLA